MKSAPSELVGLDFEAQDALLCPVGGAVQRKGGSGTAGIREAAAHGLSAGGGAMPHGKEIQASSGAHDVSDVKAHAGGEAREGASAMGATAYASGGQVTFQSTPDLHTAAHEAAHVVQKADVVQMEGGKKKARAAVERQEPRLGCPVRGAGRLQEGPHPRRLRAGGRCVERRSHQTHGRSGPVQR